MRQAVAVLGLLGWAGLHGQPAPGIIRPTFQNVLKLNAYADNWCMVYINGKPAAVDQIEFLPHNVVTVSVLPSYPMTIAVLARDNADPKTGLEYGTQVGDGGFILKLSDGTVTSGKWKAKAFSTGPLNGDTRNPRVRSTPIPPNWFAPEFDDSGWASATEYPESQVRPDGDYASFDFAGAKFIWTDDILLDNTVLFRYTATAPPGFRKTWNADGDTDITNVVNEARLGVFTAPHLFEVNAERLATGYATRVSGERQTSEPIAVLRDGAAVAAPVDLGPPGDQVYLILYGSNPGKGANVTATAGGQPATVTYAGPIDPPNGVAQFNILLPRSLEGAGAVDIAVTVEGRTSNPVTIRIR